MKSRTSFFNMTVLKKNITRFAPVWVLYSIFLLMLMVIMADSGGANYADNLAEAISAFGFLNFFYALLCAQLLFGDLYNSRMCNALHAMPLRRETWFATNVLSGLLFSVGPNAVMAIISLPLVAGFWQIPLLWLAGVTMQYLFFFGTAVLSAHCVGNRFAMGLVYVIINGFSLILYWLVETLYSPVLYGVVIREDIFFMFSPVVNMSGQFTYLDVIHSAYYTAPRWYFEDGWGYLGICAGLGVLFLILGLIAYRRRNLECAGDFVAIRWLSPVFLVLYTLCGGACCHGFFSLFIGEESYFFLLLGFVIGFFTGRMLLDRTVRVFRKKTFLAFGIFILAFSLSFLTVQFDILGIVRWVPKVNQISGVSIYTGGAYYGNEADHLLTDPAMIEDVLMIHKHGIENRFEGADGKDDVRTFIVYHMKDGTIRERMYYINHDTEAGRRMKFFMSSPETVLGNVYMGKWTPTSISVWDIRILDPEDINSLLDAILADCKAENLPQDYSYTEYAEYQFWLEIRCDMPNGYTTYQSIRASSDAEHVIAWFESHEEYSQQWQLMLENEK